MEIKINDTVTIDTVKIFEEQTLEAQSYLYDLMNSKQGETTFDKFNRPIKETWAIETSGWNLVRSSIYINQEYDWHLQSQTLTFEEVQYE